MPIFYAPRKINKLIACILIGKKKPTTSKDAPKAGVASKRSRAGRGGGKSSRGGGRK